MSEQTKISQAENAVEAVQHAVDQAESHPSDKKIEEAERAMVHTQASVEQAQETGSDRADRLQQQVQEERASLGGTND